MDFSQHIKDECGNCEQLCENVVYNYETTVASLQDNHKLWADPHPQIMDRMPPWATHQMSVVHIFFGADTTVPKLKKRLYGTSDLVGKHVKIMTHYE